MPRNDIVHTCFGTKIAETGKALKFKVVKIGECPLEPTREEWFPFSQIKKTYVSPNTVDGDYIIVSEWILKEKGII